MKECKSLKNIQKACKGKKKQKRKVTSTERIRNNLSQSKNYT